MLKRASKGTNTMMEEMMDKMAIKTKSVSKDIHLGNILCDLCAESDDSVKYLFFDCKKSKIVWEMCDRWIGVNMVNHNKPCVNFQHFHLMQLNGKQNKSWKGMWLAIIWEIWKHKNMVIFR